jgi:hypothetical protein
MVEEEQTMCILSWPTSSIANCKTSTYSADNFWLPYIFTDVCVFHFSILVSADPQDMQFGVIYLKKCVRTQPYITFSTLNFRFWFYVFGRTHAAPKSLTLHKTVPVVCQVKSY